MTESKLRDLERLLDVERKSKQDLAEKLQLAEKQVHDQHFNQQYQATGLVPYPSTSEPLPFKREFYHRPEISSKKLIEARLKESTLEYEEEIAKLRRELKESKEQQEEFMEILDKVIFTQQANQPQEI